MDNDKAGSLREALDKVMHHDGKSMIKKYDTHGWLQGSFHHGSCIPPFELQEAMKNGEACEGSEYFLKITEWIEKGEDRLFRCNGLTVR